MEGGTEYFCSWRDPDLLILDVASCSGKSITRDNVKEFAKLLYPPHNRRRVVAIRKKDCTWRMHLTKLRDYLYSKPLPVDQEMEPTLKQPELRISLNSLTRMAKQWRLTQMQRGKTWTWMLDTTQTNFTGRQLRADSTRKSKCS
ncbi:Uncharacterized protein HZ326_13842 [Fusarium oxysporum f. sp. albedinis]|nr:Uncharacterized protein HZ326_13842 [Fusarium oxysporum f. sp. albedinis]